MEANKTIPYAFKEGRGVRARTLYDLNDEPICVYFIKTGWQVSPATYHVIIEWGDMEQTDYLYLDTNQILEKFGFDITTEEVPHSVLTYRQDIIDLPNDQQLGHLVRTQANLV
jgi:hypothetical protein